VSLRTPEDELEPVPIRERFEILIEIGQVEGIGYGLPSDLRAKKRSQNKAAKGSYKSDTFSLNPSRGSGIAAALPTHKRLLRGQGIRLPVRHSPVNSCALVSMSTASAGSVRSEIALRLTTIGNVTSGRLG
jgi:hypothetical protein